MDGNNCHIHHLWDQFTMAEGGAKAHLSCVEARTRFEAKVFSVDLNGDTYVDSKDHYGVEIPSAFIDAMERCPVIH